MTGEVSEMIWVAAWGGQCWGHVPLFMSAGLSWPPCSLIPITSCPAGTRMDL